MGFMAAVATAIALTGAVSSTVQAEPTGDLASDCAVLTPIAANAITTLTPLQSLPVDEATAARDSYVGQLQGQRSSLVTAEGQAALDSYISAVQAASSPSAAPQILSSLNKIRSTCA
ncbi:hypothetical protein [Nocardia sp. NPDC050412]